jgi:hypothetical protein
VSNIAGSQKEDKNKTKQNKKKHDDKNDKCVGGKKKSDKLM